MGGAPFSCRAHRRESFGIVKRSADVSAIGHGAAGDDLRFVGGDVKPSDQFPRLWERPPASQLLKIEARLDLSIFTRD
jgi:hypothetical protein